MSALDTCKHNSIPTGVQNSVSIRETPDKRGRGLFTNYCVKSGEVVLTECSDVLLVSKSFYQEECAYCMKHNSLKHEIRCPLCNRVAYCSSICQQLDSLSHNFICKFLRESTAMTEEQDSCLQLCAKVLFLKLCNEPKYDEIMAQSGETIQLSENEVEDCDVVCNVFQQVGYNDINVSWVVDLFKKDKACGFAVMQPPELRNLSELNLKSMTLNTCEQTQSGDYSQVAIRGYGIYPRLGISNHSCLPNCSRWDNFDVSDSPLSSLQPQDRRNVYFRALHALPADTEILHSYVPISWSHEERQVYLMDMFGFKCCCIRCEIEALFDGGGQNDNSENVQERVVNVSEKDEQIYNYIQLYLGKYCCKNDSCTGIFTPNSSFQETVEGQDAFECNVCGRTRTHKEFLRDLDESRASADCEVADN